LVFIAERIFPYREEWNRLDPDFWSDFVLTNLVFPVLIEAIEFGSHYACGENGFWHIWPGNWPLLVQLAFALVIAEFFFYWTHRFGHEWQSLWKFHRVHHTPVRVYWMNSARFHPIDLATNFILYFLPITALGAPMTVLALVFTTNAATGLLEHGNIDFDAG